MVAAGVSWRSFGQERREVRTKREEVCVRKDSTRPASLDVEMRGGGNLLPLWTLGVQDGMNGLDSRCTQRFQGTPAKVTQAFHQVAARAKDNAVWALDGSAAPDFTMAQSWDEDAKVAFA